jgi:hypothetical protein
MNKRRTFEPLKISKLLKNFSNQKPINKGLKNAKLEEIWHKKMGKNISVYTESVNLSGKKLFIKIKSPTLKQELTYGENKIIKILNEELDDENIDKIIFH